MTTPTFQAICFNRDNAQLILQWMHDGLHPDAPTIAWLNHRGTIDLKTQDGIEECVLGMWIVRSEVNRVVKIFIEKEFLLLFDEIKEELAEGPNEKQL